MARTQKRTTGRTAGTATRTSTAGAKRRTTAMPQKQAARSTNAGKATRTSATNRTSSAKSKTTTKTGGRQATKAQRGGAAPSPLIRTQAYALKPIREHQSPSQIIATVARDSKVDRAAVARVARSLADTYLRHLIPRGSGSVDIPYLGGRLWRGHQPAQKKRILRSPLLNRDVHVPARRALPAARFRAYRALRRVVERG